ncbi:hypothetical protein QR680_018670 [Steinernema hermaphroditum]|uniref:ubiquitinyl hydrolase 1 n=1 Tax=Steinernema hermaphroditum TaxID=289476 RepID=A0AA39HJY6_9BILA|nr:hypothetical protein QR680_018670 [Steinernema hermaphroditum]
MEGEDNPERGIYSQLPSFEELFGGTELFTSEAVDTGGYHEMNFGNHAQEGESPPQDALNSTAFHQQLEALRSAQPGVAMIAAPIPLIIPESDQQLSGHPIEILGQEARSSAPQSSKSEPLMQQQQPQFSVSYPGSNFPDFPFFDQSFPPLLVPVAQVPYPLEARMPPTQVDVNSMNIGREMPRRQSSRPGLVTTQRNREFYRASSQSDTILAANFDSEPSAPPVSRGRHYSEHRARSEAQLNPALTYFAHYQKRAGTGPKSSSKTTGGKKPCHCSKSQCLKLYCECFAAGELCVGCCCKDCQNTADFPLERSRAVNQILQRNPNAFRPKITLENKGATDMERTHRTGCHCKKSNCLKNYCECYEAGVACTQRCKCKACNNTQAERVFRDDCRVKASPGLIGLTATRFMMEAARSATMMELSDDESDVASFPAVAEEEGPVNGPSTFLSDAVVESAATRCLAVAGRSPDPDQAEISVLNEFALCLQGVIDVTLSGRNVHDDFLDMLLPFHTTPMGRNGKYRRSARYFEKVREKPCKVEDDEWLFRSEVYVNGPSNNCTLLEEMETANDAIVPDDLRNLIKKYEGRFNNNEQQDAQEFLSFFLDELHEDLNRVVKKPYIEYSESVLQTHAEMGREAWENHRKREDSVVVDLAHLQVKHKRTCATCSTESVRFESAVSLTLELPEEEMFSPHISLLDCIEKHTSEELLGEDNAWFCLECQKMQEAKLKTDLWKLPKILILHLKRFRFCGNSNSKIESSVTFPLKGFKLLDNSEDETCVYDLVGVCTHVGSDVNRGHYTALVLRESCWYYISDRMITELHGLPDEVSSTQAYVLIYRRRGEEDPAQKKTIWI